MKKRILLSASALGFCLFAGCTQPQTPSRALSLEDMCGAPESKSSPCLNTEDLVDVNRDGIADRIFNVLTPRANILDVYLRDANGNEQPPKHWEVAGNDWNQFILHKIEDINGDGHIDLVWSAFSAQHYALGNGDGTFDAITFGLAAKHRELISRIGVDLAQTVDANRLDAQYLARVVTDYAQLLQSVTPGLNSPDLAASLLAETQTNGINKALLIPMLHHLDSAVMLNDSFAGHAISALIGRLNGQLGDDVAKYSGFTDNFSYGRGGAFNDFNGYLNTFNTRLNFFGKELQRVGHGDLVISHHGLISGMTLGERAGYYDRFSRARSGGFSPIDELGARMPDDYDGKGFGGGGGVTLGAGAIVGAAYQAAKRVFTTVKGDVDSVVEAVSRSEEIAQPIRSHLDTIADIQAGGDRRRAVALREERDGLLDQLDILTAAANEAAAKAKEEPSEENFKAAAALADEQLRKQKALEQKEKELDEATKKLKEKDPPRTCDGGTCPNADEGYPRPDCEGSCGDGADGGWGVGSGWINGNRSRGDFGPRARRTVLDPLINPLPYELLGTGPGQVYQPHIWIDPLHDPRFPDDPGTPGPGSIDPDSPIFTDPLDDPKPL